MTFGLVAGVAVFVAGCQGGGMTYGTGVSPGMQTLTDIVGVAAVSNEKQEPVKYGPRPAVVAPPTVADLPPPQAASTTMAAVNWPNDPDVQSQQLRDEIARRQAAGEELPTFSLPAGATAQAPAVIPSNRPLTAEETAALRKQFADARGMLGVDEYGNPVRRYLTDPPSQYRMPDPASPTELSAMPKKPRKFLWWTFGGNEPAPTPTTTATTDPLPTAPVTN